MAEIDFNNEQTKPDKCCMTCYHFNIDYCRKQEDTIENLFGEPFDEGCSPWETYCDEHKEKEKEEEIYNYICEMIPNAMELLDEAIKKGMPKYYLVDMMVKKRLPKNIQDKVMMAINWRYKKLQATEL